VHGWRLDLKNRDDLADGGLGGLLHESDFVSIFGSSI
jgi:hypothetical protein